MAGDLVPLVVVDDRGLRWAVYANEVRAIADATGWPGEPPIDVARMWGAAIRGGLGASRAGAGPAAHAQAPGPGDAAAARVLVVDTERGVRALLSKSVSFRNVPRSTILSLPSVLGLRGAPFVHGVVFHESEDPVIVLNVDRIEGDERN